MTYRTPLSLLLAILLLVVLSQSVFVVPQGSLGVTRRFSAVIDVGLAPGAHLKLPFLDQAAELDAGGITLDSDSLDDGRLKFTSADGQPLEASYFALWHIRDPERFCAVNDCDESAAARQLDSLVVPALRELFAGRSERTILDTQATLTAGLAERLDAEASRFGASLSQVDITGVTLPAAGLEDVYTRMRSAVEAKAAQVRSQGAADAARKHAETDTQQDEILAQADASAARLRAAGEAEAAAIAAQAARPDPDFYRFYAGLAAYRRSLAGKTVLVLDPSSPFMKYLQQPSGQIPQK